MNIYSAAIVGVTGYSGRQADRILQYHPSVKVTGRFASKSDDSGIEAYSLDAVKRAAPDVVLTATQTRRLAQDCARAADRGLRVIDMSGAFRMRDASLYPKWYGFEHTSPALLQEAVYGTPTEIFADKVPKARLVANPGCYATSATRSTGSSFYSRSDQQQRIGRCRWQIGGFWCRTSPQTGNAFLRSE